MSVSKLSDRNRLLGASLKNLNPTAIYNKVNEVVDTVNYNSSQLLSSFVGDFTSKVYTVKYSNLVGVISVGDNISGDATSAVGIVVDVTADTISFNYSYGTSGPFGIGENITDNTSSATATIDSYIVNNEQEIILKGGNKFIITDVLVYDNVNTSDKPVNLGVSYIGINTNINYGGDTYFTGSLTMKPSEYVNTKSTINITQYKVLRTNKLYLSIAGADPNQSGYAKVNIYGIALD